MPAETSNFDEKAVFFDYWKRIRGINTGRLVAYWIDIRMRLKTLLKNCLMGKWGWMWKVKGAEGYL